MTDKVIPFPNKRRRTYEVIEAAVSLFTITHGTADYGLRYVVRERRIVGAKIFVSALPLVVKDSLDEARFELKRGRPWLVNIGREGGDDPVIVESWV